MNTYINSTNRISFKNFVKETAPGFGTNITDSNMGSLVNIFNPATFPTGTQELTPVKVVLTETSDEIVDIKGRLNGCKYLYLLGVRVIVLT